MRGYNGLALAVVGALHSLVALCAPGLLGFGGIWAEIGRAGVVDAVSVESLRIWGWYWFAVPGLLMVLFGSLCHWIKRRLRRPLPLFVGAGLLAISAACILLDVDTGF